MLTRMNVAFVIAVLVGCTADDLRQQAQLGGWPNPEGAAHQLSSEQYANLSAEQQYQVVNKLAGTLYKGVAVDEFFDVHQGLKPGQTVKKPGVEYSDLANKMSHRLTDRASYTALVGERHSFSAGSQENRAVAEPLATLFEIPLSRDHFENWMAYELANSILFSPAEEIDSASFHDVDWVYNRLVDWLRKDKAINEIVYSYMASEANWRRFRSPEDNTREMIEIFLGLFDRDADVPRAAQACKNWWIDEQNGDYVLKVDVNKQNAEPLKVLDQWVVTCEDVYRVIAGHPLLIPRITTVLVDRFFANATQEKRAQLIQSILGVNPSTFAQIFAAIVLSEEYLLHNERPKSFEETLFNTASRVKWKPAREYFNALTSMRSDSNKTLKRMGQPVMSLKLGRFKDQPLDSLSFAQYHKSLREEVMIAARGNTVGGDRGWGKELTDPMEHLKSDAEQLDYVFLSVVGRRATNAEAATLLPLMKDEVRWAKVGLLMDYLSRLPELYYLTRSDVE